MSGERVSVIIPVFNREETLEGCVNSVLSQSHRDFEIILIDDGSTDNSRALCESFCKKSSEIKLILSEHLGVSGARNLGLEAASGDFVFFLDSDDIIHPLTLEELVSGFRGSDAKMGGTNVKNFYNHHFDELTKRLCADTTPRPTRYLKNEEALEESFTHQTPLNLIGGAIMRRDFIADTRFRNEFFISEDYLFIYENLIKGANCVFLDTPRYFARIHKNNSSRAYDFNAFYSRFNRRVTVWKSEEALGRQRYADIQKRDAFSSFNLCIRKNKPHSADAKKMRQVLKKYRREMSAAFSLGTKALLFTACFMPSAYSLLNKARSRVKK